MPKNDQTMTPKVKELEAERLTSGPRTTRTPPPSEEAKRIVARRMVRELKKRQ
jgi:hypothetical protein